MNLSRRTFLGTLLSIPLAGCLTDTTAPEEFYTDPAEVDSEEYDVVLHWFWGDGCPHCADQKPFLTSLLKEYDGVAVVEYEIYNNDQNQNVYEDYVDEFNVGRTGVPMTFANDEYWVGDSEQVRDGIESYIESNV